MFDESQFDMHHQTNPSGGQWTITCKPYLTERRLPCKERWRLKRLVDILKTEFRLDEAYVCLACKNEEILINQKSCAPDSVVKNGDEIFHRWLAIEPTFTIEDLPYQISSFNEQLVAVWKPAGLPTVPQGKFFKSNLVEWLRAAYTFVQPVNRLDRCVSGLVIFKIAPKVDLNVEEKIYVAKVCGQFPTEIECTAKLSTCKHVANQVLRTQIDSVNGKEALTKFSLVAKIDDNFSIVLCRPVTGRTHQIRAHLGHLGFPIVGDSTYDMGTTLDQQQQPDSICLLAYRYKIRIGSEVQVFTANRLPGWLPKDVNLASDFIT